MKKLQLILIVLLLFSGPLTAQSPEKFNYQAVARDASGNLLANQNVSFRISILQGSESGTAVYVETHAKTTNDFGQVTLNIGGGTPVSGTFSTISWGSNSHYLKTEMDASGGSIFTSMGSSQLLSVPYALYSNTSGSGGGTTYTAGTGISVVGNTISNTAPDQVVSLTMGSGLSSSGSYPSFTLSNTQPNATHTGDATGDSYLTVERIRGRPVSANSPGTGQVLKWDASQQWIPANDNNTNYTPGTGISVVGSTISNTLPDQVVTLTMGGGLSSMGSYPNFTLTNTQPNATHSGDATGSNSLTVERIRGRPVSATAPNTGQVLKWDASQQWIPANDNNTNYSPGTGISISGSTITNTAPDQVVTLTMGGGLSTMGAYPNFTLTNSQPNATHSGDATGSSYLTVERIRGRTVSATAPSTGQVLKWDASQQWVPANDNNTTLPSGSTSQTLRYDGSNWVGSDVLFNNGTGLGIGATPLTNTQLYVFRPSSIYGADYSNIYARRSGTSGAANGGTSWALNGVDAAIKAYSFYGNTYSSAIAGYSDLDYVNSAAVIGSGSNATTLFGALAYKDASSVAWAGYFIGNVNIDGTMRIQGGNPGAGKVLSSDANGNASWQTLSGASAWATSGNHIYSTNSGNVGIGTSTPAKKLEVSGDALINGHTVGRGGGNIATNLAIGQVALLDNTSGNYNTAIGLFALYKNTVGVDNTANGYEALGNNTTGHYNTAVGSGSLRLNTTGGGNTSFGTTALEANTTGNSNVAIGNNALFENKGNSRSTAIGTAAMLNADSRITGRETFNTAVGYEALRGSTTPADNTGQYNTAVGDQALYSNTSGYENVAIGYQALYSNTTGYYNTANGVSALNSNTTGYSNTAHGFYTLKSNTTGKNNVAIGERALRDNVNGSNNTACGYQALLLNTTGSANVAIGLAALYYNTTGIYNTASGEGALIRNTTGNSNTGMGWQALSNNSTGSYNVAVGVCALGENTTPTNVVSNTAIGYYAGGKITTGYGNVLIGEETGRNISSGFNNVWIGKMIGNSGDITCDNTIIIGAYAPTPSISNRAAIGNTSIEWIGGNVTWSTYSDMRFKNNIKSDIPGLDFILKLNPVSYQWDVDALNQKLGVNTDETSPNSKNIENIRQTGFLAQEVEEAAKVCGYDFSGIDKAGDVYSLSYSQFVVPIVKAMQEQQALIEQLSRQNAELLQRIEKLESQNK